MGFWGLDLGLGSGTAAIMIQQRSAKTLEKSLILISQTWHKVWRNGMAEFCSGDFEVWEVPASLKRCIEVILRIELKQGYYEILESVLAVLAKLSWNFHPSLSGGSALAKNRQRITDLSIYFRDMTCFDSLYLKKSLSACRKRKYRNFIWAKGSTTRCAVMVHSARRIALLLASFDVTLSSAREKPSWIDWTIENFPATR